MKKKVDMNADNVFNLEGKEFSVGDFLEKQSDTELILLCNQLLTTMKLRKIEISPYLKPFKVQKIVKTKKLPESKETKRNKGKKPEKRIDIKWIRKYHL